MKLILNPNTTFEIDASDKTDAFYQVMALALKAGHEIAAVTVSYDNFEWLANYLPVKADLNHNLKPYTFLTWRSPVAQIEITTDLALDNNTIFVTV